MNKFLKVSTTLLVAVMLIVMATTVFAGLTPGDLTPDPGTDVSGIRTFGQRLVAIIQTIGVVVAVVIMLILGIKYMLGSAEDKAEYKKSMIPYIVGAILIFASTTIVNIVYQFAKGLNRA